MLVFMDMKKLLADTVASRQFEGFTIQASHKDSRLHLTFQVQGSVDLPGEADAVVAQMISLLGLGNSKQPSESQPS